MEKDKKNVSGLPKWEMGDDCLIATSALANARALIYTFVEAAIAHNDQVIEDSKEEKARAVKIEAKYAVTTSPTLEPDPHLPPLTKQAVNSMLFGSYTLAGTRRWWSRPRKSLGMKTPNEMWEIDPQRVYDAAKNLLGGPPKERKD